MRKSLGKLFLAVIFSAMLGNVSSAQAVPKPDPEILKELFSIEMLDSNIEYIEQYTGKAKKRWEDYRYYKIGKCTLSVKYKNDFDVVSLELSPIDKMCPFVASEIFGSSHIPENLIIEDLTFEEAAKFSGRNELEIGDIPIPLSWGNAVDPTLSMYIRGARYNNFTDIMLESDLGDGYGAFFDEVKRIKNIHSDTIYVPELENFNIDYKFDDLAWSYFKKNKVKSIKIYREEAQVESTKDVEKIMEPKNKSVEVNKLFYDFEMFRNPIFDGYNAPFCTIIAKNKVAFLNNFDGYVNLYDITNKKDNAYELKYHMTLRPDEKAYIESDIKKNRKFNLTSEHKKISEEEFLDLFKWVNNWLNKDKLVSFLKDENVNIEIVDKYQGEKSIGINKICGEIKCGDLSCYLKTEDDLISLSEFNLSNYNESDKICITAKTYKNVNENNESYLILDERNAKIEYMHPKLLEKPIGADDQLYRDYEIDMSISSESAKKDKAKEYAKDMKEASNFFGLTTIINSNFTSKMKSMTSNISRICYNATQDTSYYESCISDHYQYLNLLNESLKAGYDVSLTDQRKSKKDVEKSTEQGNSKAKEEAKESKDKKTNDMNKSNKGTEKVKKNDEKARKDTKKAKEDAKKNIEKLKKNTEKLNKEMEELNKELDSLAEISLSS